MSNEAKLIIKSLTAQDKPFVVSVDVVTLSGEDAVIQFHGIPRHKDDWIPVAEGILNARLEKGKKALEDAPLEDPEEKPETMEQVKAFRKKRIKELSDMQKRDLAKEYRGTVAEQIEEVLKCANGWALDDAFNKVNLALIEAKFPGCLRECVEKYGRAVNGERVKN